MEWTVEEVFKVITLYRQFPCLWDYRSSEYKRVDLKKNAWEEISKNLNKSTDDTKKKIKNLRSAYVMEKKKMDESKKSGSAVDDIYRPHLYYFQEMRFLDNVVVLRKTTTNFSSNICEKEVIELSPETVNTEFYEYSQESFSDISLNETPTTSTKSKTKKIKLERGEKINSALDKILSNCEEKDTMFSSFGKSVELQLSEMSLISATKAMAEIQLVLSKFMEAESKSNILEKAIYNSEIF